MPSKKELNILKELKKVLKEAKFEDILGESPLGTLYLINHPVYGKCTLKYLKDDLVGTKTLKKIINETKKVINLEHPNFCKIYRADSQPCYYILREWIEGINLGDKLKDYELTPVEATEIMIYTALALQAGYNFEIKHRNLKLSNIIINKDDSVKVTDFLIPPTTPFYLSPEQCARKKSDIRSDIYSIGAIYYNLLTGQPPFIGKSATIMKAHLEKEYPKHPSIPEECTEILDKTLAKDPEKRYKDPLELVYALRVVRQRLIENNKGNLSFKESLSFSLPQNEEELMSLLKTAQYSFSKTTLISLTKDKEITEEITAFIEKEGKEEKEEKEEEKEEVHATIGSDFLEGIEIIEEEVPIKPDVENIPEDLPESIKKALIYITEVRPLKKGNNILSSFNIIVPNKLKNKVINYLQLVLKRECWIIKELNEKVEIVVDLDLAKTLRYFNYFEDKIQSALSKLPKKSTKQSVITQIKKIEDEEVTVVKEERESIVEKEGMYSVLDTIMGIKESQLHTIQEDEKEETKEEENPKDKKVEEKKEAKEEKTTMELVVNFQNPYQTRAWFKLVKEHDWKPGKHFILKGEKKKQKQGLKNVYFEINLLELQEYERKRTGVSKVKEFFQGDYEISRLDHGGMAAVLKLTTKNDTIIFLRPENRWAREKFKQYLCVRKGTDGKECVFAEVPKGTEFVVKVAFEGKEEALIYEARLLSTLTQDPKVSKYIIGMIQQGSFLATVEDESESERVGYYLMLEYASWGNVEQFSKRFPYNRLPISITFLIMYGMVVTLEHLKKKGIIHRDIKPQNILLDSNGIPKLSDFGLAVTVQEAGTQLNEERRRLLKLVDKEFLQISNKREQAELKLKRLREKLKQLSNNFNIKEFEMISLQINEIYKKIKELIEQEKARAEGLKEKYRPMSAEEIALKGEFAGSLYYAAPEQFSPSKILTCQCDVYQLGAVSYTMLTGEPPVKGRNIVQIMSQIVMGQRPHISDILSDGPLLETIGDLIYQMMERDPEARITIEEVREKMDDILLKYQIELKSDPTFVKPIKQLKTPADVIKWKEKVEYAKGIHRKILPELEKLIEEAEKRREEREKRKEEIKKDIAGKLCIIYLKWDKNNPPLHFRFNCPNCKKKLQLPFSKINKKIRCPNCQQRLIAQRHPRA